MALAVVFCRWPWCGFLRYSSLFLVWISPFIYAVFKAIEWRWWVTGLRIGEVRFESDLDFSDLMGFYWKVIGWIVLFCHHFLDVARHCRRHRRCVMKGTSGPEQFASVMQNPSPARAWVLAM